MNNRNPNKENTYSNLAAWCEKYHKESGIKIHPSSVPVELVLEDLMGYIALLMSHDKTTVTLMESLSQTVNMLQTIVDIYEDRLNILLSGHNELDKRLKEVEEFQLNSTKKAKK